MFILNDLIWQVRRVEPYHPLLLMPNGKYAVGVCDDFLQVICISNKVKGSYFKWVLCHEIVHAAMFSYNIKLDIETEELLANVIARYGHEIINITDIKFREIIKREYH